MKHSGDFSIGSKVWPGTSKLIEEMGELQQVLGKLLGSHGEIAHYDGSNLRERLIEEIADLRAALTFFEDNNFTVEEESQRVLRSRQKLVLFNKWQKEGK